MFQYAERLIKRVIVFIPGLVIVGLSLKYTVPYLDKRFSNDGLAFLVAYILAAYVFIPAVIRFWRIITPPEHLPLYSVTPDGFASDPINVGIIGTRREVIQAMEKAGWYMADSHSPLNLARVMLSLLLGWSYANAPVSSLYLFGRKQDLAFEIPIGGAYVRRHHVRFWATTYDESKPLSVRSIHWHHRREHLLGDNLLWVGAASLDTGLMPIRHNMQLTHMVHPDTNKERELIIDGLKSKKLVSKTDKFKLEKPYTLVNRAWRAKLQTDGMMSVAWLKRKS